MRARRGEEVEGADPMSWSLTIAPVTVSVAAPRRVLVVIRLRPCPLPPGVMARADEGGGAGGGGGGVYSTY